VVDLKILSGEGENILKEQYQEKMVKLVVFKNEMCNYSLNLNFYESLGVPNPKVIVSCPIFYKISRKCGEVKVIARQRTN
jgi:hypothetical protein